MPNNVAIGPNGVVAKQTISFASAGITSSNTAIIYKVGNPNQSFVPGREINAITGFVADTGYYMVMLAAMDLSAYVVPPIGGSVSAAPLAWTQLRRATDAGSGTLNKLLDASTGVAENDGGTAVGKLTKANGNYVQFVLPVDIAHSNAAIFGLASNNAGTYVFGEDPLLAGVYVYSPDSVLKQTTGTGDVGTPGTDTTIMSSLAGSEVIRLEISGNDVLAKVNGVLKYTYTGVLTSVTNIWVKAMFAGTDAGGTVTRQILTATGLGVA